MVFLFYIFFGCSPENLKIKKSSRRLAAFDSSSSSSSTTTNDQPAPADPVGLREQRQARLHHAPDARGLYRARGALPALPRLDDHEAGLKRAAAGDGRPRAVRREPRDEVVGFSAVEVA